MSVGEDVEKLESFYVAGGNEKQYSNYGKEFGSVSKYYN